MRKLTEPYDILWKNLTGVQGHFLLRRMMFFVAGLLIIVFVSSPTVLFANIKKLDEKNYFDFDWIEDSKIAAFARDHLPAFIILNINLLLLQILDYAALYEKYETHSLYQRSLYIKSVIYLILNMLVIPALTLSNMASEEIDEKEKYNPTSGYAVNESGSLFTFIYTRQFNIARLLGEIYAGENGIFFVSLILQTAIYSSCYYLCQVSDLLFSYMSPWLTSMKRKVYVDQEPWLRKEGNNFLYGYFYAQTITIFSIFVFFSATIPLVNLATVIYIYVKHFIDCLNILNVNRMEIDSQGLLVDVATNSAYVMIVSYQICMMALFAIKGRDFEAAVCTFMFIISIFYIVLDYKSVNDNSQFTGEDKKLPGGDLLENDPEVSKIVNNWR